MRMLSSRILVAAITVGFLACASGGGCATRPQGPDAEIVVVGGTPAGIAASVAAARLGRSVVLVEPTAHIGGIVASGLTNVDIIKKNAVGGIYAEFVERIRQHYAKTYGTTSPQYKECRAGHHFEPKVAEATFLALLNEQAPRLSVLYQHQLLSARTEQGRIIEATFEDLSRPGSKVHLSGRTFIDATYEGDLAAAAGVKYRVGRESRAEFDEKHAGVIYARFGHDEFLPGSTGEGDAGIQGFCFRFMLTKIPDNRVPVRMPHGYNRDDYRHLLADIKAGKIKSIRQAVQFWPLPNDRFEINSDHPHPDTGVPSESLDLAEENWGWPEANHEQRSRIFRRYWAYQEGLVWFLQNDDEVPQTIRNEASQYGFCKDEFTDNGNRPWQMYVRQGRRIMGEYRLTQNDGNLDPQTRRTRLQPTSIGIAEYPFDSHGVHKFDPKHPGVREGYIYIRHEPIQIPYGVIVPQNVDGLLVPVACSATHVGYQAIRMEPVFMNLGQAAATAAHLALARDVPARRAPIDALQHQMVRDGCVITYYEELDAKDPSFAAFNFLGARGLNPGYRATPAMKLTRQDAAVKLHRVLQHLKVDWKIPDDRPEAPLTREDLASWLQQAGMTADPAAIKRLPEGQLPLRSFVDLVYSAILQRR